MVNRIGEVSYNSKNEKMTIIAYRKYDDIDIQFEDGTIIYNKRYDNFKSGLIKHPIKNSFAYYIENELGLNLDDVWNWKKNNENGINPYKISKCNNKKVWIYCQEHDYHNDYGGYEITCANFYRGDRCSYCSHKGGRNIHPKDSFAQWGIDNFGEDFLEKYWSSENTLNPWELSPQSNKKIYLYCQEHDYHNYDREGNKIGYKVSCNGFYRENRCSYCYNYKTHYKDSLAYKYPNIAKMIAIPENNLTFEDCYNISCYSNKKFYFKCLNCNTISNKKLILYQIVNQGYSCLKCGDGIPITEKIIINVLNQLNINYIHQLTKNNYDWCNNYRYDFYIPILNMIIETHGEQHYIENKTNHWRTLEEEQWNDLFKYKCAKGYIDKYIVIDCRYSTLEWLKENIIKELGGYFDLSSIDWELAWEESQKSKCIEAWELWNNGIHSTIEIGEKLNTTQSTTIRYLKRGAECEKCDYTKEKSMKSGAKKRSGKNNYLSKSVICLTTGKIFYSISEASKYYNCSNICLCCQGKRNYCGKLEDGTRLIWRYLNWKHNKKYRITKEQYNIIIKFKI